MQYFIATVETSNTATQDKIQVLHWLIQNARSLDDAKAVTENSVTNINRTIPAITNTLITVEPFKSETCEYLGRHLNCQGHPFNNAPILKQARGGNEG